MLFPSNKVPTIEMYEKSFENSSIHLVDQVQILFMVMAYLGNSIAFSLSVLCVCSFEPISANTLVLDIYNNNRLGLRLYQSIFQKYFFSCTDQDTCDDNDRRG